MGSLFRVNIYYVKLASFLSNVPKTTPIYGASLSGENIFKKKLNIKSIVVIGNESKGISSDLIGQVSEMIKIPPVITQDEKEEQAESLNAAAACAIILSEIRRQNLWSD
jgi:TrmH family RNA methyltransferase